MKFKAGSNVILRAPCKFRVLSGIISIFGKEITPNDGPIQIPHGRSIPLHVIEEAEIALSEKCRFSIVKELFPPEWKKAIEEILNRAKNPGKPLRVLILGSCDTGKSSLTLMVTNILVEHGLRVGVIDTDIGQSKVGIPGIIASSVVQRKYIFMENIPLQEFYFIGDNTPTGHLLQMVVGSKKMLDYLESQKVNAILIDTTGMVFGGPARALKYGKLSVINPDLVVIIERDSELLHFRKKISPRKLLVIKSPRYIKKVSRENRIKRRRERVLKFFNDAKLVELDLNTLTVENAFLATGISVPNPRVFGNNVIYAEVSPDNLLIIYNRSSPDGLKVNKSAIFDTARKFITTLKTVYLAHILGIDINTRVKSSPLLSGLPLDFILRAGGILSNVDSENISIQIIPSDFYNGLLVGLSDYEDKFNAIGILKSINFEEKRVKILLKRLSNNSNFNKLWLGYLYYDDELREVRRRKAGIG